MSNFNSIVARTAFVLVATAGAALASAGLGATDQISAPVPEPGAMAVFGAGAVLIGIALRKGRRS